MNQIPVSEDESVIKPIGDIAKLVTNTSTADMLLFLIALERKRREDEKTA